MLDFNIVSLANPRENTRGKYYLVNYLINKTDSAGWMLDVAPPELSASSMQPSVWYRLASNQRHIDVAYRMKVPFTFIPGKYRIETFVPARHASVARATFAITTSLDGDGKPVEQTVQINMVKAKNEWVSLGEYVLDIKPTSLVGRVRQFDDTDEGLALSNNRFREISFGPVRWTPLYQLADPLYVGLDDSKYCKIVYLDPTKEAFLTQFWSSMKQFDFDTRQEWAIKFRRGDATRKLHADYRVPDQAEAGVYRIEVFIPFLISQTSQADYVVKTGIKIVDGQKVYTEVSVPISQAAFPNQWTSLGEFSLTPEPLVPGAGPQGGSLVGQVSQYDVTPKDNLRKVSFGPVRWVPRFEKKIVPSQQFDMPIGNPSERAAQIIKGQFGLFNGEPRWLQGWYDATPFLEPYVYGMHTGADLNLAGHEDLHEPIFAAGDGVVTFAAQVFGGTWNYIIVIEHPVAWVNLPDGRKEQRKVYTRYGHVHKDSLSLVKVGNPVSRGQHIGFIGFMTHFTDGAHLHFDVSHTDILKIKPSHWPDMTEFQRAKADKARDPDAYQRSLIKMQNLIKENYLNPLDFLVENHNLPDRII